MAPGPDPYAAMTAFNRFGLGAKPGDLALAASDPRGFLLEEIRAQGAGVIPAEGLSSTPRALQMFFAEQQQLRVARETAAAMAAPLAMASANASPTDAKATDPAGRETRGGHSPNRRSRRSNRRLFRAEAMARFNAQLKAGAGLVERLVAFWSNHFAVSVAKGQGLRATAGAFEREAIRPHVLGKFSDLLIAVELHPAMIFYLDNQRSIGPGLQRRPLRRQGA